jgi:Protein of unknown function (DUF4087)
MLFLIAVALAAAAPAQAAERRCGWLHNPTPANWFLVDRAGEWLIGMQGGHQAAGMDDMPDMSTRGWVTTNGSYGYGCACMTVTTDRKSMRVVQILSAKPVALRQCRSDRRLPRP